ncbi:unnamed protein product [Mytilus edulis]|uniref:Apple domain-containing protein n=1 Tax=Mytilus edulis TaxID=6550 RepID=A0A8S3RBM2_MYTED|nr:unnamed protein product [Mytilus edulis]
MDVLPNFVLFFLHIQSVVCLLLRTGVGLKNTEFTDFKITEQHLNAVVRPCLLSCSVLCFENTKCLSFSYNKKTQECELWEDDFIDISITRSSPEIGWRYYYIIRAPVINGEVRIQGVLDSGVTTWRYDNNDLITYFNWNKQNGQPSLNANEIYLLIRKSRDYRWHDIYTYEKYGVVSPEINGEVRIQGVLDSGATTWRYDNKDLITYFNWNKQNGQPSLNANEIYLLIRKSRDYRWHHIYTYEKYGVVCQIT